MIAAQPIQAGLQPIGELVVGEPGDLGFLLPLAAEVVGILGLRGEVGVPDPELRHGERCAPAESISARSAR
ncbi:hypothetical protein [Nocardia sp. NPDC057227]|uniref:hypothetical protein n=1 Tax=Nocardia sp. NPDC057227 TaxID=3346056 RepID=UPI0036442179